MKKILFIISFLHLCIIIDLAAQEPPSGNYYFVTAKLRSDIAQYYGVTKLSTIEFNENLNILALLLGDKPEELLRPGQTLVPKESCTSTGGQIFSYQPFAFRTSPNSEIKNLPIGPRLAAFLDNYFGNGAGLELTLPFTTINTQPGFNGMAWLRRGDSASYHGAVDFMSMNEILYDVCAAADGSIIEKGEKSIIVSHMKYGKEFRTRYGHLDPTSISGDTIGQSVLIGQSFCKIVDWEDSKNEHLHFSVGLKGPAGHIDGVNIPELFYAIDPMGVYDYRRDRDDINRYNYFLSRPTPGQYLEYPVRGAVRKIQWKTNPLINSLIKVLKVNERQTERIEANKQNNITTIFVSPGQKYSFKAFTRDKWKNSPWGAAANADGVNAGPLDGCRREQQYKMMKLVGDVFTSKSDNASAGISFMIGMERGEFTIPQGVSGFLTFFANDCSGTYSDNSGSIGLHIERIR